MYGTGRRGYPGGHRNVQFAAGGDVEQHPFVVGQAGHRPAEERLGGVHRPSMTERCDRFAATNPQLLFVVDEHRRAELGRDGRDVAPADGQ